MKEIDYNNYYWQNKPVRLDERNCFTEAIIKAGTLIGSGINLA
jgi:hypothetical protein